MSYSESQARQAALEMVPRHLGRWLGESVLLEEGEAVGGARRADLMVRLGEIMLVAEVRGRTDVAAVAQAAQQAQAYAQALDGRAVPLVVVPYMSASGRERLKEEGVSWIDLSGNACLRVSASDATPEKSRGGVVYRIYVWVEGRPNQFARRGRPSNPFAPKASRIARHLLLHPSEAFSQRELAKATGLGEGYVSRLVRRLEDLDLVVRTEEGAVRARDYELLLDAWAEANAYRHDPLAGHLPGRSGEEVARRLADLLERAGIPHAFTGLAAAAAYTHAAAFRSVACYVGGPLPKGELEAVGFRTGTSAPNVRLLTPDDEGVFDGAREVGGLRCAAPVQVYVDLRHEPERAAEFMEALRQRYLGRDAANTVAESTGTA